MHFENKILEECHKHIISEFWNYFQRWKIHFLMREEERKRYLSWADTIACSRADAIVSGQHRNHYGEVAGLLATPILNNNITSSIQKYAVFECFQDFVSVKRGEIRRYQVVKNF